MTALDLLSAVLFWLKRGRNDSVLGMIVAMS